LTLKNVVTWKSESEVTQGHWNWYGSIRYLWLHSNHEPISHHFQNKRRFQSKITNFSHAMFLTPQLRIPRVTLGIGYQCKGSKKLEWCGYQMVKKVLR